MGIEPDGPLLAQTDVLAVQLGLTFDTSPQTALSSNDHDAADLSEKVETAASESSLSLHAVMSAPTMVHKFSEQVRVLRAFLTP